MPANAKIPLLELGKGKPTMLNLSVANEVVKTVNGIRGLNFLPVGAARVDIADDTITVTLNKVQKPFGPVNPYVMGETGGGSSTGGGSADPPNPDLLIARTDTWERGVATLDITDALTDGVEYDTGWRYEALDPVEGLWVFTDDSATARGWYNTRYQTFYRTFKFDADGLFSISAESYGPIVADATFNAT